ncbi:MAG: glycine cleavage system aminomethyltransferase GcvT [Chloroflexi bacterium]|nr:glycine cleavage system aminomethyltransferase GcvT [Chloroflexota bacterium]MYK62392.1 glycine cleavage system aminomethyltransferase GcvT [Chloroflexota bacterium]
MEMNKRTPLYEAHVASGATMVPFGGWEMPVRYPTRILHEVGQVRNDVGIFDVSHMARLEFTGADSGRFLDTVLSVRASRLEHGQGRYHMICNEDGGIIDDAIVYNLEADRYLLVVNAGNADVDKEWLSLQKGRFIEREGGDVDYVDRTDEIAMIAVQGPNAVAMLGEMTNGETDAIGRFHAGEATLDGERILAARTGYTGEDGFEIMFDSSHAPTIWAMLIEAGATRCGLGARDALRLEAGLMLHGVDMTVENNPYEAGLRWTVRPNRSEYLMGEVLRKIRDAGTSQKIAGFEMRSRGIARHGHAISIDGEEVGVVTSGSHSPTLGSAIAMGYIDIEHAELGTGVQIDVRGKTVEAEVVPMPFYPHSY